MTAPRSHFGRYPYGPASYKCWDLLRADHVDLTAHAYEDRYSILKAFSPCPLVKIIPTWTTSPQKETIVFDLLRKGAEGVVFKNRLAPYQPGRAGQHFKLKFENSATVRVRSVDPTKDRACIEMLDAGRWIEVSGIKIANGSVQRGDYISQYISNDFLDPGNKGIKILFPEKHPIFKIHEIIRVRGYNAL